MGYMQPLKVGTVNMCLLPGAIIVGTTGCLSNTIQNISPCIALSIQFQTEC